MSREDELKKGCGCILSKELKCGDETVGDNGRFYYNFCNNCLTELRGIQKERQRILELIIKLKDKRDIERKNNNIFRKSVDELNEEFISELEELEQKLKSKEEK